MTSEAHLSRCFLCFDFNMSASEWEISEEYSSDLEQSSGSETSEGSFRSAEEYFLPYDESIEPIATEQEAAHYAEQVAEEEEEEEILWSRFAGEESVEHWFVNAIFPLYITPFCLFSC